MTTLTNKKPLIEQIEEVKRVIDDKIMKRTAIYKMFNITRYALDKVIGRGYIHKFGKRGPKGPHKNKHKMLITV